MAKKIYDDAACREMIDAMRQLYSEESPIWSWVNEKNIGATEYKRRSNVAEVITKYGREKE